MKSAELIDLVDKTTYGEWSYKAGTYPHVTKYRTGMQDTTNYILYTVYAGSVVVAENIEHEADAIFICKAHNDALAAKKTRKGIEISCATPTQPESPVNG